MNGNLKEWHKFGWLKEHWTSQEEIGDLLAIVDRDLAAADTPSLHTDWRFNIAYNAALQIATAALAISGYQAERSNHHYRVVESLAYTLGVDARTIGMFDTFRKKRNISDYERADTISDAEAGDMIALARKLRRDLVIWIRKEHPEFKP